MKRLAFALLLASLSAGGLLGQSFEVGIDPSAAVRPPTDAWPTYNGDYSGRRFSPLTTLNTTNVSSLSLEWMYRTNPAGQSIKATPLFVNGVLYFSVPDHAWAVDARTGREIWHHAWKSAGGMHIGNRGVGVSGDWLYYETPDCHLVSLNMKDGTERWRKPICDLDLFYYSTTAPVIIKNHVISGVSGDDLDVPGYLQAHDPATGELQWRWYVVPQKEGDPGLETWPSLEAARHGGGMTWQPVTYDPELNLLYVSTGNPQPVVAHRNREGSNLFTASIVALDVDTGQMKWYFQASPHDTHDWDATQVPVLIDGTIDGKPRKLLAQASRNGYYFLLDRVTGKALVSKTYVHTNWSLGVNANGNPIPNPAKEPQIAGALTSPNQAGGTNWPAPSFSPQTGLFYVNATPKSYTIYYIYDADTNPQGWGGTDRGGYATESALMALDYRTGVPKWTKQWESGASRTGVLSTAGGLVFTAGPANTMVALNAHTGATLWQTRLNGGIGAAPITYMMDGKQRVVVTAGDTLWSFVLHQPQSVTSTARSTR